MRRKPRELLVLLLGITMNSTMIPTTVFANENTSILEYNQSQINNVKSPFDKSFNISNDYSKLKYEESLAWNMTQSDRVNGPNALPEGIFVPEAISDYIDVSKMNFGYRIFSIGVTGTEIKNFKEFINQELNNDPDDGFLKDAKPVYEKLTYPLGDMYVEGDSKKIFSSSSDELSTKGVHIKANMKPYMDAARVNYTGDSHKNKSDLKNDLICEIRLPEGVSIKPISGDIKNNIKIAGDFYSIKDVNSEGNMLKLHLYNVKNDVVTTALNPIKDTDMDIDIHVSGIYYTDQAKLTNDYIVEGFLSGFTSVGKDSSGAGDLSVPGVAFDYSIYSIKQDSNLKDETHDLGGIMSVTLSLKSNVVTFKDEAKEDVQTLVESGNSIENDIDKTQSMPANPTKDGYVFKEWNTSSDGKGTTFTSDTIVNEDMTVYAIYNKKAETINSVPTIETKDTIITKGENFDLKKLVVKAIDKEDGDLTDKVTILDNGGFDKDKIGEYTITFEVNNSKGAAAKATAKVSVKENSTTTTKIPKTGDKTNMLFYSSLLGLSLLGLLGFAYHRRK